MKITALLSLFALAVMPCVAQQNDPAARAPSTPRGRQPVVFINGDSGVTATTTAIFGIASSSTGKHDETMEMARDLLKSCPEVSLTVDSSKTDIDYALLLNRQEEHMMGDAISQVMLLRPDKTVIFAGKQGRVSKAVRDGCKAILADWKEHGRPAPAKAGENQWWQATAQPQPSQPKK